MTDELERFLATARGSAKTAKLLSLDQLHDRCARDPDAERWGLAAIRGRLVELSARGAAATLTAAFELVVEAQTNNEPIAWLMLTAGSFYPPDVAEHGVDLAALVVVRAPEAAAAARAAERVLRSGAFGMVVIDLGAARLPVASQGRLVTLAQTHDAAVVCITEKPTESGSLGSLVSLRVEAMRRRDQGGFTTILHALKDKQRGPGWTHTARRRGPSGLV